MTIKELEQLSGMERANIRYYEKEGLIAPKRHGNGYRDYSEDEYKLLLKIKLLRSLNISIEEIRLLIIGETVLSDTLSKKLEELEDEKQNISFAQEICRVIKEDRIEFNNLDAEKYINEINTKTIGTANTYFESENDKLPYAFNPWRRYFARMVDFSAYNLLLNFIIGIVFHTNIMSIEGYFELFVTIITIITMLFVEPLLLRHFGTTFGKAIFGLRIERYNGDKLTYSEALERTWAVIGQGEGYYIPIYSLVKMWKCYTKCDEKEIMPWDENICYIIKDTKWWRTIAFIGYHILYLVMFCMLVSAQQLPPNRGELTVAEYVENFNYYLKYFDMDYGKVLDENGSWKDNGREGVVYINPGLDTLPQYKFVVVEDEVKKVYFDVEITNSKYFIDSYTEQMVIAALSLAGAQREVGLFSKMPERIVQLIDDNKFKSFSYDEGGVTISSDTENEGFDKDFDGYRYLIVSEDSPENYFRLSYSVSK